MADQVKGATNAAKGATNGAAGGLKEQVVGGLSEAARDILGPALQQMSQAAAEQAATFAKEQGPKLVKEQVLPQVMKSAGVDDPADLAKAGIGKAGAMLSGSGGITGIAGKLMGKLGGGKGGGKATGWGDKRRMPVQQDVFVSVNVEDVYKGWTEYKRWTEFMHRANLVSPEPDEDGDDGGAFRLKVTEKMWGFKRPFTAEVVSQKPNEHIRWSATEGTKHAGVIAFHELGPRLTLISVNIDHAPSGPVEKFARGNRFVKRAIRADLHRFKGWIEHKSEDEIAEMEGWLGTIEDSQIVERPEDYEPEGEPDEPEGEEGDEPEAEAEEDELEDEEPEDEDEAEEEPEDEGPQDDYDELSVRNLREELRDRDLSASGNRRTLVNRLRRHDAEAEAEEQDDRDEEEEEKPKPRRRRRATSRR
jgi:uncharacterized membrane protein